MSPIISISYRLLEYYFDNFNEVCEDINGRKLDPFIIIEKEKSYWGYVIIALMFGLMIILITNDWIKNKIIRYYNHLLKNRQN